MGTASRMSGTGPLSYPVQLSGHESPFGRLTSDAAQVWVAQVWVA